MPLGTPQALEDGLGNGLRGGVFFIHGPEAYLRAIAERAIIAAHVDPATTDFNLDRLSARDTEESAFASVLQTPPMMAEWRVVILREAEALSGAARLRKLVEGIVDQPPPGLVLVLVADLPARSSAKVWKRLRKETQSVECARLDASDLPGWLATAAGERGVTIAPETARSLVGVIGTDLGVLTAELDKLCAYVGDRGRIEVADVEAAVGPIRTQDRWAWFDLVGSGKLADARAAIPVLLDGGESGVGLVLGLGTHFLRLGLAVNGGPAALESALPPHQRWVARRLSAQAGGWNAGSIRGAVADLARADRLLKSTNSGDRAVLEELLHRLSVRRAPRAA
ncbi:MAG: DNA polymerase III subunit delta [Gemmatimonadota bacterium]